MESNNTILRFEEVSFGFGHNKPILDAVNFSVRRGAKITLMGQNGAGKSTIFQLVTGALKPESGSVPVSPQMTIAVARQVIPREQMDFTVRDFFEQCFAQASSAKASDGQGKIYDIDRRIDSVLEVVHLHAPYEKVIRTFSGGQQARLLLAAALIQKPDLLLLDEPTNNLDKEGIAHLRQFIVAYPKTCIVISHDADFLNAFTQGVLYLDVHTRKVEQYQGNYFDVREQITTRMKKENSRNARLAKEALENKEKANYFAMKGGRLRLLAKRMREKATELEEAQVQVRREDRAIRPFTIPCQEELFGEVAHISAFSVMRNHKPVMRKADISLRKNRHLLLAGPNGIGKSTLLESLANGSSKGASIAQNIAVGYYRQDFSNLTPEDTVQNVLASADRRANEERLRSTAAAFLITADLFYAKIGSLSEGQKGLTSFARLVLLRPGLLLLDEPTNHMNFRHIPVIAEALNKYEGAMILVSHVPEFIEKIRIDETLNLEE